MRINSLAERLRKIARPAAAVLMLMAAGCSRHDAPTSQGGNQSSTEKPSIPSLLPFTPSAPPPFKIYYEKDPVPEAVLAAWKPEAHPTLEQKLLVRGADGKWPADGDVYVISPRYFSAVTAEVKFREFADSSGIEGVNPAFTGHPFDPENRVTRPWRWTPYVFYVRHNDQDKPVKFEFRDWTADDASLWPADWNLLLGILLRAEGKSVNLHLPDREVRLEKLAQQLARHSASEADCGQALLDKKIQHTFLPASWRLMHQQDQTPDGLSWFVPLRGTITQFDHLAIRADSARADLALNLVQFLMDKPAQDQLLKESGYFSVKSEPGKEWAALPAAPSPLSLPAGAWFNGSEFLVDCPPVPVKPEAPKTDTPKTEVGKAEPAKTEAAKPEPPKPDASPAKPADSESKEPVATKPVETGSKERITVKPQ